MRRPLEGTQCQWVKDRLLSGRPLSHRDLIRVCRGRGGHRLAAYIYKLRRQEGWPIRSESISGGCPANPPVRYSVPPGWRPGDPAQLRLPL